MRDFQAVGEEQGELGRGEVEGGEGLQERGVVGGVQRDQGVEGQLERVEELEAVEFAAGDEGEEDDEEVERAEG